MKQSPSPTISAATENLPPIIAAEQYASRILLLDSAAENWDAPEALIWDWNPIFDNSNMPPVCIPWFGGVTDCKPIGAELNKILITASCGAVALVEKNSKRVDFCVCSPGAHSAELLPGGNVVAVPAGRDGGLDLFDISTYDALHPEMTRHHHFSLPFAHGAVWDKSRNCLWANGMFGISKWEYRSENPLAERLAKVAEYPVKVGVPFRAHDLFPVPGTPSSLFMTGAENVIFDIESASYRTLAAGTYKSISQSAPGGPIIVTSATEQWWTPTATLLAPNGTSHAPFRSRRNMRFYKLRWFVPNGFSY